MLVVIISGSTIFVSGMYKAFPFSTGLGMLAALVSGATIFERGTNWESCGSVWNDISLLALQPTFAEVLCAVYLKIIVATCGTFGVRLSLVSRTL